MQAATLEKQDLTRFFYQPINDDSMEPILSKGDLVLAGKCQVSDGEIAVVITDFRVPSGRVKKLQFETVDGKESITLISRNPEYRPETYPAGNVIIAGKVLKSMGELQF